MRPILLLLIVAATACRSPSAPPLPPLEIATTSLPSAMRGAEYLEPIYAAGGDGAYFWDIVDGELPVGLALIVDDLAVDHAIISGIPEVVQTATFTVRLRSGDNQEVTRQFTISVVPEGVPVSFQTSALPPALVGAPYDVRLRATGGDATYVWTLVGGTLPAGLALTPAGRIQGTPTTVQTTSLTLQVQSAGHVAQAQFELRVVPHNTQAFRLTIFEVTSVSPALQPHIAQSVARLEAAITGNLEAGMIPSEFFQPGDCAGFGVLANGTSVDDVLIMLSIVSIDGPGGVLGRAGPCGVRQANSLPFAGIVALDADDLLPLVGTETLTDIITHEIAHVLGFGTLWQPLGLVQGIGGADPRYIGARGVAEYAALGGTGGVPLETQGGEGTRDGHWRKTVFNIELMTGFAEPVGIAQPLSRVSIAQWEDMGFVVNMAAAQPFTLSGPAVHADAHAHGIAGFDEIYRGPVRVLHDDGRSTLLRMER
jgi:hypothetical protein